MDNKDDPILPSKDDPIIQPGKTPEDTEFLPESESSAISVDTDSRLTPISREKIQQVDADQWANMTASQLFEQLQILEQRKTYAARYSVLTANQLEPGIRRLRELIKQKTNDEVNLL
jgi:hypothetical protein